MGIDNICVSFLYLTLVSLFSQRLPRLNTVKLLKALSSKFKIQSSMVRGFVAFFVLADEHGEHGGQQHENQRLNKSDEQFHEVKWNGRQPAKARDEFGHGFQHVFAGENISVKPEAKRDRT